MNSAKRGYINFKKETKKKRKKKKKKRERRKVQNFPVNLL